MAQTWKRSAEKASSHYVPQTIERPDGITSGDNGTLPETVSQAGELLNL